VTLFRVRLRLKAPLGTPLSSGTLFGHLCWAKRAADGEEALVAWLASLPEQPWALSDGFPHDRLPFPMLPRSAPKRPDRMDRNTLAAMRKAKEQAKRAWIGLESWRQARERLSAEMLLELEPEAPEAAWLPVRLAHNSIDRHRGSTPEEGGLFFVDEDWGFAPEPIRDVWVRAETTETELRALFAAVGEAGYGRDATWGRGWFEVDGIDTDSIAWLDNGAGDHRLSLSHGFLTPNMSEPRYKLFTLFGKLGAGMVAEGVSPWKMPLLLTRPGCTFRAEGPGPFGAWLTGVHPERPEIGHNGFHLAIPFSCASARAPGADQ
jgi:CRISPR-associated protein Csm4